MESSKSSSSGLGLVIRAERLAREWTQGELAKRAGYSQMSISKVESGRLEPSEEKFEALAEALGLDPGELLARAADQDGRRLLERAVTRESSERLPTRETATRGPAIGKAVQVARANRRRVTALKNRAELLSVEAGRRFGPLEESHRRTRDDFLEPFFQVAIKVDGLDVVKAATELPGAAGGVPVSNRRLVAKQTDLLHEIGRQLAFIGGGAVAGAGVGGVSAAAAYSAAAAFATASTGTTISALTGVAASNATLAFLGGGSLAAGGFGVAGGIAVMSTIVAAPALLAAGLAATVAGHKMLNKQRDEESRIQQAEMLFEETNRAIQSAYPHAEEARRFLAKARQRGRTELSYVRQDIGGDETDVRPQWSSLSKDTQSRMTQLMSLAVLTLTILPLPVIGSVQDSDPNTSDEEGISRANQEILDDAFDWFRVNLPVVA